MIEQLTRWCETRRQEAVKHALSRLRGKLSDADCAAIETAFSRFQNQFLHAPIRALTEETHADAASGYTLAEALLKLFRLPKQVLVDGNNPVRPSCCFEEWGSAKGLSA